MKGLVLTASLALAAIGVITPARAGGPAAAPEEETRPVTLAEALAAAETANPELQAGFARRDAQLARAESARRATYPRLGLASTLSYGNLPAGVFANKLNAGTFGAADFDIDRLNDPGALDHLGTTLSLEVPIDVFGKIRALSGGQSAYGEAAAAATLDATQEVRLRVVEAYRRAHLAGLAEDVTARALAVAKAREEEIRARVDEGAALQADLLRARTRRRQREADLAARHADRGTALAALARVTGAPAGTTYVPTEAPGAVGPLEGDETAWGERAVGQRAAIAAAQKKAAGAGEVARSERAARLPDLGAFAQLYDNRTAPLEDDAQAWAVGVGFRWTPYDATRQRREAAAAAEQRAAEQDARAAQADVRFEVARAYRRAVAARERHAAAGGGAEEGREALRVVRERRQAGVATLTDELDTEAAALAAELDEIAAAAEVAIADAALRRAAGDL